MRQPTDRQESNVAAEDIDEPRGGSEAMMMMIMMKEKKSSCCVYV